MGNSASTQSTMESAVKARKDFRRTMLTLDSQETAHEYLKVTDRVERFVKPEHGIHINILSIERIENPGLDRRLCDVFKVLQKKDSLPELLIHGTGSHIAEIIIKEGFRVGTEGMFGAGIYFATDSTKSAQYCRDPDVKSLLLCEVALGKTLVCDSPMGFFNSDLITSDGYDSVFAKRNTRGTGGVLNDEFIVYRPEQAAPRYLVKFRTSELRKKFVDKAVQCDIGTFSYSKVFSNVCTLAMITVTAVCLCLLGLSLSFLSPVFVRLRCDSCSLHVWGSFSTAYNSNQCNT